MLYSVFGRQRKSVLLLKSLGFCTYVGYKFKKQSICLLISLLIHEDLYSLLIHEDLRKTQTLLFLLLLQTQLTYYFLIINFPVGILFPLSYFCIRIKTQDITTSC